MRKNRGVKRLVKNTALFPDILNIRYSAAEIRIVVESLSDTYTC